MSVNNLALQLEWLLTSKSFEPPSGPRIRREDQALVSQYPSPDGSSEDEISADIQTSRPAWVTNTEPRDSQATPFCPKARENFRMARLRRTASPTKKPQLKEQVTHSYPRGQAVEDEALEQNSDRDGLNYLGTVYPLRGYQ